jgi:phenylacetate-CoA ligase
VTASSFSNPDSVVHSTAAVEHRLRQHLAWAHGKSGFYRDRFDPAVFESDEGLLRFAEIPLVSKSDVIEDQLAAPPFGTGLCVPREMVSRIYTSVGSLITPMTSEDLADAGRAYASAWRHLGIGFGDTVDIASTYHRALGGTVLDESFRDVGAAVIPGGPGETSERLRLLRDADVTVLQAFTPYAEHLAGAAMEAGIDPKTDFHVRLLLVGGEMRDSAAKTRLGELWGGASIVEGYGAAEVGCVAWECSEAADGMHLLDDVLVEVVDPDTGDPTDARNGGELVLTELYRRAQPWIRFRTGDIVEHVVYEACACGLATPRLGRIVGRRSNILRVRGVFVSISFVAQICREAGLSRLNRVIVTRASALDEVTVELASDETQDVRMQEEARVVSRLRDALGLRVTVTCCESGVAQTDVQVIDERDGSKRTVVI